VAERGEVQVRTYKVEGQKEYPKNEASEEQGD
jgi:hypothetical protein